jgi:hypothetical protein
MGGGDKWGGTGRRTSFRFPRSRAYSSSTSCSSGESVSDVSEPWLVERCRSASDAICAVLRCSVGVEWVLGARRVVVYAEEYDTGMCCECGAENRGGRCVRCCAELFVGARSAARASRGRRDFSGSRSIVLAFPLSTHKSQRTNTHNQSTVSCCNAMYSETAILHTCTTWSPYHAPSTLPRRLD